MGDRQNTNTGGNAGGDGQIPWTEGLSEEHKTFVTEKGWKNVGELLGAWPKDTVKWTDTLSSEQRGLIESKGFETAGLLVDSYQNLEKLKGVPEKQLLRIPEKTITEDPDAWSNLFSKLGRPEKAEEYKLDVPKEGGADEETIKWAKDTFHALGLTRAQGEGFIQKWNELSAGANAKAQENAQVAVQTAERELKTKWGMAYEKNRNVATMAAKQFGIDPEMAGKMASVMGDSNMALFFHSIGEAMGEHHFVAGDKTQLGLKSPEAAQYEIKELQSDKEFGKKLAEGDREARQKWDRLHQMAWPVTGG